MSEITINRSTIDILLLTLDIQYERVWGTRIGSPRETQMAYYNGMKQIADIVVTNAFKEKTVITQDKSGLHHLAKVEEA